MKVLAIDPGSSRIGLAASDELNLTTRPLPVMAASPLQQCLNQITQLIIEESFDLVLIGLPLNMDGSEGKSARQARAFKAQLEAHLRQKNKSLQIQLWDERLTSFEAEQRARERGIPKLKVKKFLDSIAAEVLLQDYLEFQRGQGGIQP